MDNFNQSTFQSNPTPNTEVGFFDNLKNLSVTTWILIILILSFLGFNIFTYLAKGTQTITDILKPLFGTAVAITGETIDVSAEGAKAVVNETAEVITTGLNTIQDVTPNLAPSSVKAQQIDNKEQDIMQQSSLNKTLNTPKQLETSQQYDYQANEASSSVHNAGKSGWCYIGLDRGFRNCAEVGVNDTCMSGEIFPTNEICINPNLRK